MFGFFITKQNIKRSLWFHLYHTNAQCTTLVGNFISEHDFCGKPQDSRPFSYRWNWNEINWFPKAHNHVASTVRFTKQLHKLRRHDVFTLISPHCRKVRQNQRNPCKAFVMDYYCLFYRLTVVVVKTRNLRPENDENENRHDVLSDLQNIFVKVKNQFCYIWLCRCFRTTQ